MENTKCRRDTTKVPCLWTNIFGEYVMEFKKDDEVIHCIFKKYQTQKLDINFFNIVSDFIKQHEDHSFDWKEFQKYVLLANKQHIQAQMLIDDTVWNEFYENGYDHLKNKTYEKLFQ
jgi:hypothetical protein